MHDLEAEGIRTNQQKLDLYCKKYLMKGITLLYDESKTDTVKEKIIPLFAQHLKIAAPFKNEQNIHLEDEAFIVTYLSDAQLKVLLPIALERKWKLGFLPHPDMVYAKQEYGISHSLDDAVDHLLKHDITQPVDVLMVNGLPVFDTVVIGECLSVMYGSTELIKAKRIWGKVKNFFKLFKSVTLSQYTVEFKASNGQEKEAINTAALGILIVQHGRSSLLSRRILENSYANDGMMHVLVLSPESILGLIKFGLVSLFRTRNNPKLPPFAAYAKTTKTKIQSKESIDLSIDDVLVSAKEIEVEVLPKSLQVIPGIHLLETKAREAGKEVYKTQPLPRGQLRDELLKGPIPLIYHATTDQFKELFTTLRENSKPTSSYLVLMFLSTFIATLGLFSNSSPVIIGAMILAPLMSPIISLSMGVLRQDRHLIRNSLRSIGFGLLLGYMCAIMITWIMPLSAANLQILSRTRPNLLDLGIAVGSGLAGAYAHAKKEIAKTLAGVAIAVALVPPLAVSGIGIGWMNWQVFSGALLLLFTNLVGIVLSAAIAFLFLGFSPFRLAKKGLIISLLFVIGISTPLAFGFSRMVRENSIVQNLNGQQIGHITLRDVDVRQINPMRISVKVITAKPLTEEELKNIKRVIEDQLGEKAELELTVGIKL